MKGICKAMSFALLFAGCYSQQVTKIALEDREVVFWLHDDSYIRSEAGSHQRLLGGYDVKGVLVEEDFYKKEFVGMVRDDQIKEITSREFDKTGTIFVGSLVLLAGITMALVRGAF